MQISLFVTLSVLLAGVMALPKNGVITPRDTEIPRNSANGPGTTSPEQKYPGEIAKWSYPDPKILKPWPTAGDRSKCSLNVQVAVGSCSSGAYGYVPEVIPYDAASTQAIEGKVRFNVDHTEGAYYDNTTVTLDCYWRGRIMVTDTPEIQRRIGLVSVRIDTSPGLSRAWVTADKDEETGMTQNQIAPISFVEFGEHAPHNKNWSPNRGFEQSLKTTKINGDKLLIQVC